MVYYSHKVHALWLIEVRVSPLYFARDNGERRSDTEGALPDVAVSREPR